ncbi:MAG: efflux RND transporter periplasmic adaptor subunit [Hyphomicrobiales bacterium]
MKLSYLWAFLILVTIGLWLGSDQLGLRAKLGLPEKQVVETTETQVPATEDEKPFRVVVQTFSAEPRDDLIAVRGRTEASRRIDVRARTAGIVEKSPLREGDKVERGDLLCQVDVANREARLAEAKASLASATRDYEASAKLQKSNYTSNAKLATDKARAEAAQAAVDQIERDIAYTKIYAPTSGIIETRPAEIGAFLQIGTACATIVNLNPIVVTGDVTERAIPNVKPGMPAYAELVTGETLKGQITFISPKADIKTRTFKVEIEAANDDRTVREGLTAELIIPLKAATAHKLPASTLTLHDNGTVGVNTVMVGNKVAFKPVKIQRFGRDHVWVSGLPDNVTVITVGQEYVLDGQVVEPVKEVAANSASAQEITQ